MSTAQQRPAHDKPITFPELHDDFYKPRASSQLSEGTPNMSGTIVHSLSNGWTRVDSLPFSWTKTDSAARRQLVWFKSEKASRRLDAGGWHIPREADAPRATTERSPARRTAMRPSIQ